MAEEEWPTPAVAQTAAPSRKKKEKKLALNEFLSGGSWADEMMESLPTAPSSRADDAPASGFGGRGSFSSQNSLPRGPASSGPLPTKPPYTAYVGNLPFDIDEEELARMFDKVKSARIVRDKMDDRPKGFGYVEFDTVDALSVALDQNGKNMGGRSLRVNVAEPPKERPDRPDRVEREDRTDVSSWRRTTPVSLPPRESRPERCLRDDRRRDGAPRGNSGEREISRADSASAWTSKWTPSELRASPPSSAPHSENSSSSSSRWGNAGPRRFDARQPDRPEEQRSEPKERPKLALKPRSAAAPTAAEATTKSTKSNPFGAAKPRDEDKALKEAEERRKRREEEEKARKEKEEASKPAAETKKDSSSEKENKGSAAGAAAAKAPIAKKAVWNKEVGSPSFATLAARK